MPNYSYVYLAHSTYTVYVSGSGRHICLYD